PPRGEPGPLHHGAERIVEPPDLLETAHPSRLRKDDERAGVVVEEVAAADRRELTVAEESDQREFAETLADQRDVVVGRAEEPAPAAGAVEVAAEGRPPAVQARRHLPQHRDEIVPRRRRVADPALHGLPDAPAP